MGSAHIKTTSLFLYGKEGGLFFESLPHKATMTTRSAGGAITDSAAAGTAMATGHKVSNNVIALAIPGDRGELTTLVEHFNAEGRLTGLVTTNMLADATPAAFGAHADNRKDYAAISKSMLTEVRPHLLFGGSANKDRGRGRVGGVDEEQSKAAGYTVITDRQGLAALEDPKLRYVAGLFGEAALPWEYDAEEEVKQGRENPFAKYPHISELSLASVKFLARSEKGFFLMIESGLIDNAGHTGNTKRMVREVAELDRAVKAVMEWAKDRRDTLIIVTADHETGGLEIIRPYPAGTLPEVRWSEIGHTGTPVSLFAWGAGAEKFKGTLDNTALFQLVTGREPYKSRKPSRKPLETPAPATEKPPAPVHSKAAY